MKEIRKKFEQDLLLHSLSTKLSLVPTWTRFSIIIGNGTGNSYNLHSDTISLSMQSPWQYIMYVLLGAARLGWYENDSGFTNDSLHTHKHTDINRFIANNVTIF